MIDYQIFHNVSARFMRGAQKGDTLIKGYQGTLDVSSDGSPFEAVFRTHNMDDRPDGQQAPSLSVGDVVVVWVVGTVLDGVAKTVEGYGFANFDLSTAKVEDGPYLLVIDSIREHLMKAGLL